MLILLLSVLCIGCKQESAEQHVLKGDAFFENGEYDAALGEYWAAFELDSDCLEAYHGLERTWAALDPLLTALAECNEVIRLDPEDVEAYMARGNIWIDKRGVRPA
jgi:tetratricopeptide (TPR) repeat protein